MLVPDELALDLDQLDLVVVDGRHDLGMPVVVEAPELLKVHRGVHRSPAVLLLGRAWSGWLRGLPTRSVGQQPARWAAAVERTARTATARPRGRPAELSPVCGSRWAPWDVELGHGRLQVG